MSTRRRIDHRVVIRKRNRLENLLRVVLVERRPSAVLALHRKHPLHRTLRHFVLIALTRIVHRLQRQQHFTRVIDVRLMIIVEEETPAARIHVLHVVRPVALVPNLFAQQPVRRLHHPRIRLRQSDFAQRRKHLRRIPHRRKTRLHPERRCRIIRFAIRSIDAQLLKLVHRANHLRIVRRVPQRIQRHNRIQHGRINRTQTIAALKVIEHPVLSLFQRHLAQRTNVHPLGPMRQAVRKDEEITPRKDVLRVPAQMQLRILRARPQTVHRSPAPAESS